MIIVIFSVVFAGLTTQVAHLKLDTSVESFFYKSDTSLVEYIAFKEQFGRDDYVVVGIQSDTIFDVDFLKRLQALHAELEVSVPHLSEIDSLINVRHTRGEDDFIIVEELLEEWPQTASELAAFKQKVMDNPLYRNLLVNEEGTMTAILLKSELLSLSARNQNEALSFSFTEENTTTTNQLTEEERSQYVQSIKTICNQFETNDFQIYITGSPVLAHEFRVTMVKESQLFISLVLLMLILLLFVMFRRLSGIFLPLFIVILITLSTLSIMSGLGIPFTLITQILPAFLLVIGIGYTIHILALFYREYDRTGLKREALMFALGHYGLAVLMTALTTSIGLFSFAAAEMATIAQLGIVGGIGAFVAFVYSIILCPTLIALLPVRPRTNGKSTGADSMDRVLRVLADVSVSHRTLIFFVTGLIFCLSVAGISQLRFAHNDLEAFSKTGAFYTDTKTIDRELKGSVVMEVVLDTNTENGLHEPAFLQALDEAQDKIASMQFGDLKVGKTTSITSIVKETNKALHGNRDEFYSIPDNRRLIAQELFLFENGGAEDLEEVTDSLFSMARLSVTAPFSDAWNYVALIEATQDLLKRQFPDTEISTTGLMILFARILKKVIVSMAESYLIVFSVITLLMILLIGRVRIGLVSMIPNVFPVIIILGIMGWLDQPLDFFNITLGSILVGISVDDTIHFFYHFRKYLEETGNVHQAVRHTFLTAGRAMITTTIVLCCGFFIYMGSEMNSLFYYGLLLGTGIVMALLADFFLAPALLTVVNRGPVFRSGTN